MGRHTHDYDTAVQAVLAWVQLLLLGVWCAVARPGPGRHESRDQTPGPAWPDTDPDCGADDRFAADLHVMNETPTVRLEVRV